MRYRQLGRSGVEVSEVGLGCGFLGHAPDFNGSQVDFNLFNQEAAGVFDHAEDQGVGIIARRPMESGMLGGDLVAAAPMKPGDPRQHWGEPLTRKRQALLHELDFLHEGTGRSRARAALEFVLSHAAVSSAIPSSVNLAHLSENVKAAGLRLTDAELGLAHSLGPRFASENLGV